MSRKKHSNAGSNLIAAILSLVLTAALVVLIYDAIVGGQIMQTILNWLSAGGKEATSRGSNFMYSHGLF